MLSQGSSAEPTSLVTLTAESTTWSMMEDHMAYFSLTLNNEQGDHDQVILLEIEQLAGENWSRGFVNDTEGTILPEVLDPQGESVEPGIKVPQGVTRTFYLRITAPAQGHAADPISLRILGYDAWGDQNRNRNITKQVNGDPLEIELKAYAQYRSELILNPASRQGDTILEGGVGTRWDFTINNQGWWSEEYDLRSSVTNKGSGSKESGWSFAFAGGTTVAITGAESSTGSHSYTTYFEVTPPSEVAGGYYQLTIRAVFSNQTVEDTVTVAIGKPDLKIGEFRHTTTIMLGFASSKPLYFQVEVLNEGTKTPDPFKVGLKEVRLGSIVPVGPQIEIRWDDLQEKWTIVNDIAEARLLSYQERSYLEFKIDSKDLNMEFPNNQFDTYVRYSYYMSVDSSDDIAELDENANLRYFNIFITKDSYGFAYALGPGPYIEGTESRTIEVEENLELEGTEAAVSPEARYTWISDIDGELGSGSSLSTSSLSRANHTITYQIDPLYGLPVGNAVTLPDQPSSKESFFEIGPVLAGSGVDSVYSIEVVKFLVPTTISKFSYVLYNPADEIILGGRLEEIYGGFPGRGEGVIFKDNDFNGKLTSGDIFQITAGAESSEVLSKLPSLEGYTFQLVFNGRFTDQVNVLVGGGSGNNSGPDDGSESDDLLSGILGSGGTLLLPGILAVLVVLGVIGGILMMKAKSSGSPPPTPYQVAAGFPGKSAGPGPSMLHTPPPPYGSTGFGHRSASQIPASHPSSTGGLPQPPPPVQPGQPSRAQPATPQPPSPSAPPSTGMASGAMVNLECPGCKARMKVPKTGAAQHVKCSSCGLEGKAEI